MSLPAWLTAGTLRQPDRVSCGPSSLVVARMLRDETFAAGILGGPGPGAAPESVRQRFSDAVAAAHHAANSWTDRTAGRRFQVPWPRMLGTAPWAVAARLGPSYVVRPVLRHRRAATFDEIVAALAGEHLVVVYVGNTRLPRHVVLVVGVTADGALQVYDPGRGRVGEVPRTAFARARLGLSGWNVPWFLVRPVLTGPGPPSPAPPGPAGPGSGPPGPG